MNNIDDVKVEVSQHYYKQSLSLVEQSIQTTWIALGSLALLEIVIIAAIARIWWSYFFRYRK